MPVFNWFTTYARRSEMRDRIPPELCDLLEKCLQVDPNIRIDASEALSHDFFKSVEERVAHTIDREFSSPTKVSV
jgi:serine/threonine protein kinase